MPAPFNETPGFPLSKWWVIPHKAGVYCLENKQTQRFYIGESVDMHQRAREHKSLLNTRRHSCIQLQEDAVEYGMQSFELRVIDKGERYKNRDYRKKTLS